MDPTPLVETPSINGHASSKLQYPLLPPIASLNYDVLIKITEFIGGNISPDSRKRNGRFRRLYYFALACKAFVDPALDELWRSMDSIVPLLKILPALQFKDNRYFILTGHIETEDLERLRIYSQRIRIFTLNEGSVPVMAQLVIPLLTPLLPKVQQLYCTFTNPFMKIWSPIILSERLQYFRLEGYFFSNTQDVKSILHTLQFTAPTLEHLDLVDPLMDDALNIIPTFIHLRSLGVHGVIEHHEFRKLALLPELRQLVVNFHVSPPFPSFPLEERITAPKLRVLHVTGLPLTITSVLAAMYGSPLEDIRVTFQRAADDLETSITKLLATLIDQWSLTLRSFRLSSDMLHTKVLQFLPHLSLYGFSHFASLEVLRISRFILDTPRCRILARSIPSIKELTFEIFDPGTICSDKPSQSLEFLQFIAESCPHISILQVNCTHDVHPGTIPDSIPSNISLKTLVFKEYDKYADNTGSEKVTTIARYIDLLFPHLEIITTSRKAETISTFWRQVLHAVKQSQDIRTITGKLGLCA